MFFNSFSWLFLCFGIIYFCTVLPHVKGRIRFQSDEIDMALQTWMFLVWSMDLVMVLLYTQVHDSRIFSSGSVFNFTT